MTRQSSFFPTLPSARILPPPCRFLQQPPHGATGPDADANVAAVEEIRSAITAGMPCVVQLMVGAARAWAAHPAPQRAAAGYVDGPPARLACTARACHRCRAHDLFPSLGQRPPPPLPPLQNYKRSGDPFVNYLSLNPVYDEAGKLTHYVGVQVGAHRGC